MSTEVTDNGQDEIFDFSYDNELPFDRVIVPYLYHYRSSDSVRSIFTEDCIRLRMRRSDKFDDKMEGKAIEVYYDIALEELLADEKISKAQFDFLNQIEPIEEELFVFKDVRVHNLAKWLPPEAYIICFSSVKNDPYMFEHYGGRGKDKYCLELMTSHMEMLSHKDMGAGTRTELFPVMYGRQVVSFLKKKILQVAASKFLYENAEPLIGDLLHRIQYAAKRARYIKENEIRLVVYLPVGEDHSNEYFEKDGEEWLWLNLEHYAVSRCWPNITNKPETSFEIENMWKQRGYEFLCAEV